MINIHTLSCEQFSTCAFHVYAHKHDINYDAFVYHITYMCIYFMNVIAYTTALLSVGFTESAPRVLAPLIMINTDI